MAYCLKLLLLLTAIMITTTAPTVKALVPYTRTLWDLTIPPEDPFRILEQSLNPLKGIETTTTSPPALLARADWKETPTEHVLSLDVPGMKKEDIKVVVEDNRVLKISGERKSEEEVEGDTWHRVERTSGMFWRQFRMPANADLENVKAELQDGVLRIRVQKLAEKEKKPLTKVVDIAEVVGSGSSAGQHDVKAIKSEL